MFHEIKFSTANHQLPNAFLANKGNVLNELVFSLVEWILFGFILGHSTSEADVVSALKVNNSLFYMTKTRK